MTEYNLSQPHIGHFLRPRSYEFLRLCAKKYGKWVYEEFDEKVHQACLNGQFDKLKEINRLIIHTCRIKRLENIAREFYRHGPRRNYLKAIGRYGNLDIVLPLELLPQEFKQTEPDKA